MLTDIACTTVDGRSYIVTADRDEHIRISRGLPQAHIIEGFCQGHDEFISRLCISKSKFHLVSGGGDAHLHVWDWLSGELIQKLPIRDAVMSFYREQGSTTLDDKLKVAVSGIWSVPYGSHPDQADEVLVACEGVPALFSFELESPYTVQAMPLAGNALDVAFIDHDQDTRVAVVSIDHVHQAGSTTDIRDDKVSILTMDQARRQS
jgi:tRNA (guanine-N(7)-)-methyltransferase subunit TRM82